MRLLSQFSFYRTAGTVVNNFLSGSGKQGSSSSHSTADNEKDVGRSVQFRLGEGTITLISTDGTNRIVGSVQQEEEILIGRIASGIGMKVTVFVDETVTQAAQYSRLY